MSGVRLFHFSDDGTIERFVPRPVRVPAPRPAGREWLNGPLVWAIDERHEPLYLFPRDCPRTLLWATERTAADDRRRWFGASGARMLAYVEGDWLERVGTATLHRYEMPPDTFRTIADAGMWVSAETVVPIDRCLVGNLPARLAAAGVELRVVDDPAALLAARETTLHVSGIRVGRRARHAGVDSPRSTNS